MPRLGLTKVPEPWRTSRMFRAVRSLKASLRVLRLTLRMERKAASVGSLSPGIILWSMIYLMISLAFVSARLGGLVFMTVLLNKC